MDGVGFFRRMPLRERGGHNEKPGGCPSLQSTLCLSQLPILFLNQENDPYGVAGLKAPTGSMTRRGGGLIPSRRFLRKSWDWFRVSRFREATPRGIPFTIPRDANRGLVFQPGSRDHRRPEYQKGFDNNRDALVVEMRLQRKTPDPAGKGHSRPEVAGMNVLPPGEGQ